MILRALQKVIEGKLFKGKAIVILGPRQVGKTTLLNQLISAIGKEYILFNCDDPEVRISLTNANTKELELLIGNKNLS
ncbi:MAG: AAA family ATPase [Bacteroidales bacterium]